MQRPLICFTVLTAIFCATVHANAQSWKAAKYDTAWLPITETQLKTEIRHNAKDATALYQLWRQARYQKLAQVAFDTFKTLKTEQPTNASILAMYCMAIEQRVPDDNKPRFAAETEELKEENRRAALATAKKLNPNLWLFYAAQDRFEYNSSIFNVGDQVAIYNQALSLEPNLSFTNQDYAAALSNQATFKNKSHDSAIAGYKKAQGMTPIPCESSCGLIMMYRWRVKDTNKEKQAAQSYLATSPRNLKLSDERRKWLAQWGVAVPWK